MAIKPLNSIAGFSTGDPAVTIVQANGDITTINFTANGISNVGNVGNFIITGGSNGQFIQTDGTGNLTFATISTSEISNGNSNVSIPSANGNVNVSVGGNANVAVFTDTGANLLSLAVQNTTNLGNVGNVTITGGNANQVLVTDGAGNLTWGNVATQDYPDPMPIVIDAGNTLTIRSNYQGLFGTPLTVDGTLEVDGMLIDVSGQGAAGTDTQITFNDQGNPAGNNGFTFNKTTGNLNVPGAVISANGANFSGQVQLGSVSNIQITGGTNGYVLSTNGSGNLSWVAQSGGGGGATGATGPVGATGATGPVGATGPGGSITYVEATANTNAVANTVYIVNTDTTAITITLPTSPTLGQEVGIIDGTGNSNVNAITVGRNGQPIQGQNADMTVNTSRAAFTLVYYNSTHGWLLTNV